ncbi:hypothetical protein ABW16_03970 [Mycolicibacter heraklionensis]|uniref:Uncharacterized protein n=1 Tax=Mycolicibacter heraklionensis TaxID=512402 RepID=A0ABR5FIZ8_9MYCO|nr:hypothetical protein ABW16_03970 [Mycolicibacter heraklionensis]
MQQTALVRVVQRVGDRRDDGCHLGYRHASWVLSTHQLARVAPVDVVHGDPQPAVELSAIVNADDVRVPKACGKIGFANKPIPKLVIASKRFGQDL